MKILNERIIKTSAKNKHLVEDVDDGWDYDYIDDMSGLLNTLDDIDQLNYEIKNAVKGTYSNAETYKELGLYIKNLAEELDKCADIILTMDENTNE